MHMPRQAVLLRAPAGLQCHAYAMPGGAPEGTCRTAGRVSCCRQRAAGSGERLGCINLEADEVIRSICVSRARRRQELAVSSVHSSDDLHRLRCVACCALGMLGNA